MDRRAELQEEVAADNRDAQRLITLDELADELPWVLGPEEVAEQLHVDTRTVRSPGTGALTDAEKASIECRPSGTRGRLVRTWSAMLALLILTSSAGCGDASPKRAAPVTPASPPASATPTPVTTPSLDSTTADALAAMRLCAEFPGPDAQVLAAIKAARGGTRTPSEIADSFRQAQTDVEALAARVPARFPLLSAELQSYANTLGRARVKGDVGVPEITAAAASRNAVCDSPR